MGFFQARVLEWSAIANLGYTVHPKKSLNVKHYQEVFKELAIILSPLSFS